MNNVKSSDTPFAFALRVAIRKQIVALVRQGTCGMSLDNLRQVTPTPPGTLDGAPVGANAAWQYAELFCHTCAEQKDIAAFILTDR